LLSPRWGSSRTIAARDEIQAARHRKGSGCLCWSMTAFLEQLERYVKRQKLFETKAQELAEKLGSVAPESSRIVHIAVELEEQQAKYLQWVVKQVYGSTDPKQTMRIFVTTSFFIGRLIEKIIII
jgi:hypothetical protein